MGSSFFWTPRRPPYNRTVVSLRRWVFRLGLATTLAAGIGYLPYRASGGIGRAMRLKVQLAGLVDENLRLEQDNDRLRREITRLKGDPRALERVARDELGLVHPDDLVFHLEEGEARREAAPAPGHRK